MKTLRIPYPEDLPASLGETEEEFEKKLRFLVAAKLYELGSLSSGRAAEMAGLPRTVFLEDLGKHRISVFNYSVEELDREIHDARERTRTVR